MSWEIRLARMDDAAEMAEIYRHFVLHTPVSFEAEPPDADQFSERIREIQNCFPWLVCLKDRQLAGYAYASQHRARYHYQWSVDVTVYVHDEFRRQRVGTALYLSLLSLLPLQGYVMAHAGITLPNPGSVRLHESQGFIPVGIYHDVGYKLGKWHDVGWWERPLADATPDPKEPLPLNCLVERPDWKEALGRGQRLLLQN